MSGRKPASAPRGARPIDLAAEGAVIRATSQTIVASQSRCIGCGSKSTRRRGTVPEELKKPENFVGNTVLIQIEDRVYFAYAHMQPGSLTVKVGDTVTRQVLGKPRQLG